MSLLFVNENNATIGIEENRCYVQYADGMKRIVPIETLESITIMGHAQMTTQCVQECLKRGIPVSYFSKGGNTLEDCSPLAISTLKDRESNAFYMRWDLLSNLPETLSEQS